MSEWTLVPKVATAKMERAGSMCIPDSGWTRWPQSYVAALAARPAVTEATVEEWARVLCKAEDLDWDAQANPMTSGNGSDDMQEYYRHQARALIAHLGGKVE